MEALKKIMVFVFLIVGTSGCFDEEDQNITPQLDPIKTKSAAEYVVEQLAEYVMKAHLIKNLSGSSFSNEVVGGASGTAIVSGAIKYGENQPCGSSCIRSQNNVSIDVTFHNFTISPREDLEITIVSGKMDFSDHKWSRQSGLYYSSGGKVYVNGISLEFSIKRTDKSGETSGYADFIDFKASGKYPYNLSGSCLVKSGETFSF
ncbi:hypothetical protein [Flexithrix dorotheae]|uniref:hypothetical protein n=1 Tax=Flexithrix dorotheae TaxID=70993 RepID=UPI000367C02D|nr:hypothetical protein [Flexithrix dorotheae]